ncbi:MAG: aminoglycoside N(3)-acetyltransferase [Promethearchaeota archaeon]
MLEKFKEYGYLKYKKIRYIINKRKTKKKSRHITKDDLISDLEKIGIKKGDVLLVHSSLKRIGYVIGGAKTVIEALLDVIGKEGTLLMPTYPLNARMLQLCESKNYIFDLNTTPTYMGAIPSEFLKIEGIYRSIHPTHSVSAIGKYANEITKDHHIGHKTYGENSPWGKIKKLDGKILGIGVSLHVNAQYHYLEDMLGEDFPLKVKVDKIYKVKCRVDNKDIFVEVQPNDPEVAKTRIDTKENSFIRNYFWEIFENLGVSRIGKIGEATSWWANFREFYNILFKLAKLEITIYSTEDELKAKKLYPFLSIKDYFINSMNKE